MKELIWTRAHFDLEVVDGALVVVFFSLAYLLWYFVEDLLCRTVVHFS